MEFPEPIWKFTQSILRKYINYYNNNFRPVIYHIIGTWVFLPEDIYTNGVVGLFNFRYWVTMKPQEWCNNSTSWNSTYQVEELVNGFAYDRNGTLNDGY